MQSEQMTIRSGAELIAAAASDAGVNFFAGYPITPASSIYSAMLAELQSEGKVALGVSDEIGAVAMCIGAAMRGAKSMTASAAPGISLMIENIAYAFATETPLLIVVGQRLGPSTGAATQNAEGDISFVANLISGGYQIPVFCINSIYDAYNTTIKAINCSEALRCPVILLSEKDLLMSQFSLFESRLEKIPLQKRPEYLSGEMNKKEFKTYNFIETKDVPEFVAAGSQFEEPRVVVTASMHDKAGLLSKNSAEALEVLEHQKDKIEKNISDHLIYQEDYDSDAQIAVISFLATDLAAKEAVKKARTGGIKIKHLSLGTLFPIPEKQILDCIKGCSQVIIPEENQQGQYASYLEKYLKNQQVHRINAVGKMINPQLILEKIQELKNV